MTFSEEVIQGVWEKGRAVTGYRPERWRKDECGAWIARDQYGNRGDLCGWDIDHITPASRDGRDELSNLRPLQWENNASRQAGRLDCVVTSDRDKNLRKTG